MPKKKQSDSHSQYLYVRNSKLIAECAVVCVKYKWKHQQKGGGHFEAVWGSTNPPTHPG